MNQPLSVNLISAVKRRFCKTGFLAQVLAVSSSAVVAQLVSLSVGPLNSRLYSPADYGVIAPFGSLFTILVIVSTFRCEMAFPVAENQTDALNLLAVCFGGAVFSACLSGLAVAFFGHTLAGWISRDPRAESYLWFLPVGLLLATISTTLSAWAIRKRAFAALSSSRITLSVAGALSTVVLGLINAGPKGLIYGSLAGSILFVGLLGKTMLNATALQSFTFNLRRAIAAVRRYYKFPLYNAASALLNTVSTEAPVLLFSSGFGPAETGWFSLCQRVVLLPTLLISGAIGPVFYSRAREAREDGSLGPLTTTVANTLAGLNVFFIVFLILFAPLFIAAAFGKPWKNAGIYAAILAPAVLLGFIITPLAFLPLVLGRQGTDVGWQSALLVIRTGSLGVGIHFHSDVLSLLLFSSGTALWMGGYLTWVLSLVSVKTESLLWRIGRELMIAGPLLGGCRLLVWITKDNIWVALLLLIPVSIYAAKRVMVSIDQGRLPAL